MDSLKQTPLYEEHLALKAKIVPFGGWSMPLQYIGILEEYDHTRRDVTLFDTCHMGEFIVEGDAVASGLDKIVTMAMADMPVNTSRYGLMLKDTGGVIDDLIVFRLGPTRWMIVVNGATTAKDALHFQEHIQPPGRFQDLSSKTGKIDVQGPLAREILQPFVPGLESLNYFQCRSVRILDQEAIVSRTGYTGELGYEIFFPWGKTTELWRKLLQNEKVTPAGLGARDVLRLEVGYSLYGHELDEETTPLEAGLEKFVDFNKAFIGKTALLKQKKSGPSKKLIGLISENRRSPRDHHKIYSADKKEIGRVTSGGFSPAMQKGIGLGYIYRKDLPRGAAIHFGDENNLLPATVSSRIFYRNGSLKS